MAIVGDIKDEDLREGNIDGLKEACDNGACERAIKALATALTGDTSTLGCDLFEQVYNST